MYTKSLAVEKSAVAKHSATINHMINFEDVSATRLCNRYYGIMVLEAIEINKHKH